MNINNMTLDELRDWHAKRAGWACTQRPPKDEEWIRVSPHPFEFVSGHPFPATLDGAASAMPEGWWWQKRRTGDGNAIEWIAGRNGSLGIVETPDTGHEITDRYRLAALAWMKEMEK